MGDNTQIVPAKTVPSETNLSTSTRPKTSMNSGGKYKGPFYSRRRRQVNNPLHAFVLVDATKSPQTFGPGTGGTDSLHASKVDVVHDQNISSSILRVATTNNLSNVGEEEFGDISEKPNILTEEELETDELLNKKNLDDYSENLTEGSGDFEENLSDSSLFTLDSAVYDELKKDHRSFSKDFKSSEVQHDAPILTVEASDDQVQIININKTSLSTRQKSKAIYNSKIDNKTKLEPNSKELTDANLSILPLEDNLNLKRIHFNDPIMLNSSTNSEEAKMLNDTEPKIKVIDVPFSLPSNNHLMGKMTLNITIATDAHTDKAPQSIYVLSLSIPTDGSADPVIKFDEKQSKLNPLQPDFDDDKDNSGGACECSCPNLSSSNEFPQLNDTYEYDYDNTLLDEKLAKKNTEASETTFISENDSTTDSTPTSAMSTESEMTITSCPEVTTKLPPPPTILILEGMV